MISVTLGTVAELIKMAPVIRLLEERGADVEIWYSDMHIEGFDYLRSWLTPRTGIEHIDPRGRSHDLGRVREIPAWIFEQSRAIWKRREELSERLIRDGKPPLLLVHGDTLTTVLGAFWGHRLGATVGHVEAGYRSGSIWSPFPEEIDRRIVGRVADIHFAPSAREAANLGKGVVVDTGANTAIDSLRLFVDQADLKSPGKEGLVTLHRFELMRRPEEVRDFLQLCREAAKKTRLLFMTGEHGRARLREHGLLSMFGDGFELVERVPYPDFVPMLARARFVMTDSGGLQQECAYLGVPCLIHRDRTESDLGIGRNVVISGRSPEVARRFLESPEDYRYPHQLDQFHPSEMIVTKLEELGYV